MDAKFWLQSKTILINLGVIAVAILSFLLTTQSNGGLPFYLDPRWIAIAIGILNIILRSVTKQPVTTKVNWNS